LTTGWACRSLQSTTRRLEHHGGAALVVELDDPVPLEVLEGHLDHADGALHIKYISLQEVGHERRCAGGERALVYDRLTTVEGTKALTRPFFARGTTAGTGSSRRPWEEGAFARSQV